MPVYSLFLKLHILFKRLAKVQKYLYAKSGEVKEVDLTQL
jgi:hypothetical protein